MIGCLMIYSGLHKEVVIDKVIKMIKPDYICKRQDWIVTYNYHQDNKINIWQAALELELDGEIVGYGFGSTIEEAKEDVSELLARRDGLEQSTYLLLLS
ncbi:hypothetical protein BN1058_01523 [Paraliobacillus sp. PM-2]|uniref:hypothetical protein n=1 Tax=Paraliobacillus sp. PM-2 TaxID=1462524 RepID=UPI00061BAF40|nr:hypothetical protein [Paraliobacillus sp. PM-2]CQR47217.1 hypothetical protein BN1058_01523 [Paraliobacillus sp. PM-2]